ACTQKLGSTSSASTITARMRNGMARIVARVSGRACRHCARAARQGRAGLVGTLLAGFRVEGAALNRRFERLGSFVSMRGAVAAAVGIAGLLASASTHATVSVVGIDPVLTANAYAHLRLDEEPCDA